MTSHDTSDNSSYFQLYLEEGKFKTLPTSKYSKRKPYTPDNPKEIRAFIPGVIRKVQTAKGKKVKKDDPLIVLEAMKMNNQIFAGFNGTIKDVLVKEGDRVEKNQLMVLFR